MNHNKFHQEKSALLTALAAQITSCKYTLEAIGRLAPGHDQTDDVKHLNDLIGDLLRLTEMLRDAADAAGEP